MKEKTGVQGAISFTTMRNYLSDWVHSGMSSNIITNKNKDKDLDSINFSVSLNKNYYQYYEEGIHIIFTGYLRDDILEEFKTCTDAIYYLYKKRNISNMLNYIDGSYSIIIIDEKQEESYIICDRLASRPLYYHVYGESITFSSNLSNFSKLKTLNKNVNLTAIASMFGSGWLSNDDTYFEDVNFLMNGQYIKVDKNGPQIIKYWDYYIEEQYSSNDKEEYKIKLRDLLIEAVEKRTRKTTPALLLSGGTDSRLLLGVMNELGRPIDTYSYYYKESRGDDYFVAERTAKKLGIKFNKLLIDKIDPYEGILESATNWSGMRNWIYEYKIISDLSKYSKNWLAGDESFGWNRGNYINEYDAFNHIGISFISQQNELKNIIRDRKFYDTLLIEDKKIYSRLIEKRQKYSLSNYVDYLYTTERLSRNILPARYMLHQQGGNVMNPWLDKDVLDFIRFLPIQERTNKKLVEELSKEMYPDIFSIQKAKVGGGSRFVKDIYDNKEKVESLLEYSKDFYSDKLDFEKILNRIGKKDGVMGSRLIKAKSKMIRKLAGVNLISGSLTDKSLKISITNQQLIDRISVMGIICNRDLGLKL